MTDDPLHTKIAEMILTRELRPGERINQSDLATSLGVSRVPVREALRTLHAIGRVTHIPNRGYSVPELRFEDLEDNYRLRELLETNAIRQCETRGFSKSVFWRMERVHALELAADPDDVVTNTRLNREFHFPLFSSSSTEQQRLISQLWDAADPYRILYYSSVGHAPFSHQEHSEILKHVENNDFVALVEISNKHRLHGLEELEALLND